MMNFALKLYETPHTKLETTKQRETVRTTSAARCEWVVDAGSRRFALNMSASRTVTVPINVSICCTYPTAFLHTNAARGRQQYNQLALRYFPSKQLTIVSLVMY